MFVICVILITYTCLESKHSVDPAFPVSNFQVIKNLFFTFIVLSSTWSSKQVHIFPRQILRGKHGPSPPGALFIISIIILPSLP